VKKISIP